jgi:hypothetical protein
LFLLSQGETPRKILDTHPALTMLDIKGACAEGLAALEAPRVETREERIARVREKYPHAFESWSAEDDRTLRAEFANGASIAALGRAFGRPPGAIRARLERLGVEWRRSMKRE